MGSFIGHVIPGSLFVSVGIWWLYNSVLEYIANLRKQHEFLARAQRSWKALRGRRLQKIPVEPWVKFLIPIAGIFVELGGAGFTYRNEKSNKIDRHSDVNDFGHASMYAFFALSGLVDLLNFYKLINVSRGFEYCVFGLAFCMEGGLFYFHLHGRDMFDVRIHTILCIIVFTTALVLVLEASLSKHRRELFMARSILTLTHGTWFFEISCTIYGPTRWFRDANVDLTEKELIMDTQMMTVSVCWHLLGWCLVMLCCCGLMSCLHNRGKLSVSKISTQRENGEVILIEDDEDKYLLSENETSNSSDEINENSGF